MTSKQFRDIVKEELEELAKARIDPIARTQDIHTKKIDALTADMYKVQKLAETTVDIVKARYEKNKREIDETKDHLGLRKEPYFAE